MARAIDADRLLQVLETNFGHTGGADVMRQLIEAQPTLTPPNEPLTLEQLREMDGEPVYCINIDDYSTKEWMIVGKDDCEGRRYIFDFSTYSRSWLAYRRPPERQEDT